MFGTSILVLEAKQILLAPNLILLLVISIICDPKSSLFLILLILDHRSSINYVFYDSSLPVLSPGLYQQPYSNGKFFCETVGFLQSLLWVPWVVADWSPIWWCHIVPEPRILHDTNELNDSQAQSPTQSLVAENRCSGGQSVSTLEQQFLRRDKAAPGNPSDEKSLLANISHITSILTRFGCNSLPHTRLITGCRLISTMECMTPMIFITVCKVGILSTTEGGGGSPSTDLQCKGNFFSAEITWICFSGGSPRPEIYFKGSSGTKRLSKTLSYFGILLFTNRNVSSLVGVKSPLSAYQGPDGENAKLGESLSSLLFLSLHRCLFLSNFCPLHCYPSLTFPLSSVSLILSFLLLSPLCLSPTIYWPKMGRF